jgi:sterol carrier protein 2
MKSPKIHYPLTKL